MAMIERTSQRFGVRTLRACLGRDLACVNQVSDFTPVLNVKDAEVTGDVDRRAAARRAAALLPARQLAIEHRTLSAGDQPAVRLDAVGFLGKLLPDLPAISHAMLRIRP